jgi:hypothetical protein
MTIPSQSPVTLEYYAPTSDETSHPIRRIGPILVIAKGAVLPDRCIKCNIPTDRRFRRMIAWYPWYLLLIVFFTPVSLLIVLVLYLILRKTMYIDAAVCPCHLRLRRAYILLTFVTMAAAFYSMIYALAHEQKWSMILGFALLGLSVLIASTARILRPTKIDAAHGYFRGASPQYLDTLPGVTAPPR